MNAGDKAVTINGLVKAFDRKTILGSVSLHLEKECIYGLVGLNGSGKTTLIRLLLGLLKKDAGAISVLGYQPWDHNPSFYRNIGVVLESDGFYGNMTVGENLRVFAAAKGLSWDAAQDYFREYWAQTDIYTTDKKVKFLSRGQRVQCGLCRAFLGWPRLYVLDEPAVSLDVTAYEQMKKMVLEAKNRGATVIISSHQLETIDDLCDRVGLLRNGVVEEISHNAEGHSQVWLLCAENSAIVREIIQQHGGSDVGFEKGYWKFTLKKESLIIPEIINSLVSSAVAVREVWPQRRVFSDSIRDRYNNDS